MLLSWLRSRRRRRLLAEPFPIRWAGFLDRNVGHFARLSPPEQDRLRDVTRILVAEKRWHGRSGLFVSEEMKVTIAAQAALLLLGTDHGYFSRVRDVVVFPTEFRTPVADDDWEDDGLSETPLAGQAVDRGPVILAWDEVLSEGRNPDEGFNVVVHEFAHQLDFLHGLSGGTPPLGDVALERRWHYVFTVAFEDHRRAVRGKGRATFFTPHAADSETEFFADASEAFFCRPRDLRELHAELYGLLAAYYRLDPTMWISTGRRNP
jgi:Mlc titration factor MtfA (ptsG expression regulator)